MKQTYNDREHCTAKSGNTQNGRNSSIVKRTIILICVLLFLTNISAIELIHSYWGDYVEIVRIVLVQKEPVHYNTMMDTDNRVIRVMISQSSINNSLLPIDFSNTPLISHITYEPVGRDIRVSIFTNVVFFAESFFLVEENFKIVLDVYRQREPSTLEQAMEYLNFYRTVGFLDRANALQRRINNNDFVTPIPFALNGFESMNSNQQYSSSAHTPPAVLVADLPDTFLNENLLLYMRPDSTNLGSNIQSWINMSFRVYDIFTNFHISLEQVERTLILYDSKKVIDITFIDSMSTSSNILSDANIRINEIRLQFQNALNSRPPSNDAPVRYTYEMIQHVLSILDAYHHRVQHLQREFVARVRH